MVGPFLVLIDDFLKLQFAVRFLHQDLDPAFGTGKPFFAFTRELHALFKELEAFLKRQVAVLELTDDRFKLIERFFEGLCHT